MLSTQPYKGARDFFPEEMRFRKIVFSKLRKVLESFGFDEVDAPIIEPKDIYLAKTSEEIVNQQMYTFVDRGGREVALRPEMTPTISRMVAHKLRELPKPIKWYSIPNLWRYERPSKGRLREHWQVNADIFAAPEEILADVEIIQLAINLLLELGANEQHFEVKINDRRLINAFFESILKIPIAQASSISRIMDKRSKVSEKEFVDLLIAENLSTLQIDLIQSYLNDGLKFFESHTLPIENPIEKLFKYIDEIGLSKYCTYDSSIVRGFDYYTGMVFEIYDKHESNRRSLFGGGRYDNLISYFSKNAANAVGFGLGDVTLADFLEVHSLIDMPNKPLDLFVTLAIEEAYAKCNEIANQARSLGLNTEVSLGFTKIKKQFQEADQKNAKFVAIIAEDELQNNTVTVRNMKNGEQNSIAFDHFKSFIKDAISF